VILQEAVCIKIKLDCGTDPRGVHSRALTALVTATALL